MKPSRLLVVAAGLALAACGPNARGDDGDDGDDGDPPDASNCSPVAPTDTVCDNGQDDDCDGAVDCVDNDCWGVGTCPDPNAPCEVETPSVSFPLPDGNCTGISPPMGASDAEFQAYLDTCGAYDGVMNLTGFPAGARLTNTSQLLAICATMEHTYLRDMQIEAHCPDGQRVALSKFQGTTGGEVFLGVPITEPCDFDPSCTPVPGTGYEYCWRMTATMPPLIDYANQSGLHDMPAGDYLPSEPFTGFMNCTLNGAWTIRVIDGWGIDNGVVFGTRMEFDGNLSDDCPIIE
jgi:hypothetical protein